MSLSEKISKGVRDNIIKIIATLITGVIVSFSVWGYDTFKAGLELEANKKSEAKFDSLLTKRLNSPQYLSKILPVVMESKEVKTFAKETTEKVIQLTEKDSVQLRGELRVKMDLRQSQRVPDEIAWTYNQIKRLPYLIDSVVTHRVRRSQNIVSH